jgi:hypothetical protein
MANFWRCERSEASDVGHEYPHRPLARKGCRLVGVAAPAKCRRLLLLPAKAYEVTSQSKSQVTCRATRPPFDIPAISYSTPLITTAPGAATDSLSGPSKLVDMYMCRDYRGPCRDRPVQLAEAIWPAHDVAVLVAWVQIGLKAMLVCPLRSGRQKNLIRQNLPPKGCT